MSLQLSSPVTEIPRIGPAKAKYLAKLDIAHTRDFLYTFPRRYDDFSKTTNIEDLTVGEQHTIRGRVKKVKTSYGYQGRRRLLRIFVDIEDETGTLAITWFNLHFLAKQLWEGRELAVAGKIELNSGYIKAVEKKSQQKLTGEKSLQATPPAGGLPPIPKYRLRSPVLEFIDPSTGSGQTSETTHTGRITPVYPETYGVTSRFLRYHIKNVLPLIESIPEYLPEDIRERQNLIGIHQAIKEIHFPTTSKSLEQAQHRLRFDELFFLQLAAQVRKSERTQQSAHQIKASKRSRQQFIKQLPFKLTNAQQGAVDDINADLSKPTPMNRLLQGDVGSGKSAVALIAAHSTLQAGAQVLYLAPTEILARQQADSFRGSLKEFPVQLLIGSSTKHEREKIQHQLNENQPFCLVGTHALLQDTVSAPHVALAIVDEQHRFGVTQRRKLQRAPSELVNGQLSKVKGQQVPHLLSMTATPIPRTLTLTLYGDLDVSIIDELPSGRQPIKTSIVSPQQRDKALTHVLEELHSGRQAFVIAPLVEESDKLQAKSAKETLHDMQQFFPGVAVELVHGKMPSAEKQAIMQSFTDGAIQLLCSTAVVEVGINVPNATCMIIEGAERFGLSQLHQFRGRVGRGEHKSYCYLFPTSDTGLGNDRLKALSSTTNGFKIAEKDLELRGPGEVYGTKQSGYGDLKVASLLDYPTIKIARQEAEQLLAEDPKLKNYPILQKKVAQKNLNTHFE